MTGSISSQTIFLFMKLLKILFFSAVIFTSESFAQTFPARPATGNFIVDEAEIIKEEDKKLINETAQGLLKEKRIPIFVVTVNSLLDYNAIDGIDHYSSALFNNWGIGYKDFNYGILLLIAKNERMARIEFGSEFNHRHDADAQKIMNEFIIPEFKKNNPSKGITNGVKALNTMARGLVLPKAEVSKSSMVGLVIFALLIGAIVFSLFKNGKSGWGWAVLAAIGLLLFFILRSGASGGGFGGGGGGGGGASGSW
jgi:uncharacterized protein